jgi:peroxiredoxin
VGVSGIAPHLPGPGEIEGRTPLLGEVAPEFQLRDEEGNFVTLRRLIRPRPLLLYFYRGGW